MYQFLYSLEKHVLWEVRLWKINHYINLYVHCEDAADVTVQSVILLIKRRFIPTDMESIWYMSMMPVKSTGHKEMQLTAKHNSLEEK